MRGRRRSSGKRDPSDESEAAPSIVVLSSSDDEEANEDLSLAIVKKARHREAKRKWSEDALGPASGEYYYSRRREAIGAARVCDH
ncbi:hypothetical protein B296_00019673 [Ensete ventricosum]|uniref:Uncharacterized protein n=1 Tax=Ensete ventricosum TaxID=4639 RepID=A0A426Z1L8_ENSVE|nr:hypothetical protein B296_00019673 [Ensete ventricosum]